MNKVYTTVDEREGRSISSQLRWLSLGILSVLVSYYMVPTVRRIDPDSTNVLFIHFLCFAFHYGAQLWVTFIAGILMFLNLPRVMFGHLQCRMFPAYFVTTLILSSVTLVTYTIRHPYSDWTPSEQKQVSLQSICVISTFLNACILAPEIVQAMVRVFNIEKSHGTGHVVGYADRTELKKIPEYRKHYVTFRIFHGISGICNVTTLICNTMYLYHLACLCVYMDLRTLCEGDMRRGF